MSSSSPTSILSPADLNAENEQLARRLFEIRGWEAYFVARNSVDPDGSGDPNGVINSYWALHDNALFCYAVRQRDGNYVIIPWQRDKIVYKYLFEFEDDSINKVVEEQTGNARYRREPITYDYFNDPFIAPKIRAYVRICFCVFVFVFLCIL